MNEVPIIRKVYGKNSFQNVVDTNFSQLINPDNTTSESLDSNVESFFRDYDNLFFDIPPSGSENTHLELVKRSSDYIGFSFDDLQEELRNLREENVSLKNQLFIITQNI